MVTSFRSTVRWPCTAPTARSTAACSVGRSVVQDILGRDAGTGPQGDKEVQVVIAGYQRLGLRVRRDDGCGGRRRAQRDCL